MRIKCAAKVQQKMHIRKKSEKNISQKIDSSISFAIQHLLKLA